MDQKEGVVKRMDLGVVFRPRAMVRLREFVFKRFVNYFQQRLTQTVDSHLANFLSFVLQLSTVVLYLLL